MRRARSYNHCIHGAALCEACAECEATLRELALWLDLPKGCALPEVFEASWTELLMMIN